MCLKRMLLAYFRYWRVVLVTVIVTLLIFNVNTNNNVTRTKKRGFCPIFSFYSENNTEEGFAKDEFTLSRTAYRSYTGDFILHHHFRPSTLVLPDAMVTLSTFTTVNRLHEVLWLLKSWAGPISIAVYTPDNDYSILINVVNVIRKCLPDLDARVSYHILYPSKKKAEINFAADDLIAFNCNSSQQLQTDLKKYINTHIQNQKYVNFPQNHLRNLARQASLTPFSFPIDIDMIPTPSMYQRLNLMLRETKFECSKCVLVVPTYEIDDKQPMLPGSKSTLMNMIKENYAQRYHIKVNEPNQGNTNLDRWEKEIPISDSGSFLWNLDDPDEMEDSSVNLSDSYSVMYSISDYKEFWEPIIVIPSSTPYYDERFVGYGFTRNSLIYELHSKGYKFHVLDECFLSHWGFQTTQHYPRYRNVELKKNLVRYEAFKRELKAKYAMPPKASPPARLNQKKFYITKRKRSKDIRYITKILGL